MNIFTYHHCDAWKTWKSMDMADEYYPDTPEGRKKLFVRLMVDTEDETIILFDGYTFEQLEEAVMRGSMNEVNNMIEYGYISVLEPAE